MAPQAPEGSRRGAGGAGAGGPGAGGAGAGRGAGRGALLLLALAAGGAAAAPGAPRAGGAAGAAGAPAAPIGLIVDPACGPAPAGEAPHLWAPPRTCAAAGGGQCGAGHPWVGGGEAPGAELLVLFREYALQEELEQAVAGALRGMGGWEWVPRANAATEAGPTDFGVVLVTDAARAGIRAVLAGVAGVKGLHPNHRLFRSLRSVDPEAAGEGDVDGGGRWDGDGEGGDGGRGWGHGYPRMEVGPDGTLHKVAGRMTTPFSRPPEDDGEAPRQRRALQLLTEHHTKKFKASVVWGQGIKGAGVRVGVFDTGLPLNHPHFRKVKERTNWTHEKSVEDKMGHGSHVAGCIASVAPECPGLAPDVDLMTFKVFTNDQYSYTSWYLDAFNYAIHSKLDVINLSIGGPDYLDFPFVYKVREVVANGIIIVSAIGNDGPRRGTLNNPADSLEVIAVGGVDYRDSLAGFSSRGMTTHELPFGYGRPKPDIVSFGVNVMSSKPEKSGCRALSGTSVASPVATGAVALLASTISKAKRAQVLNPGSMKQALLEGADRLSQSLYEVGAGRINLLKSANIMREYQPRASLHPATLDFTDQARMWPHSKQQLYAGALPYTFNATIVNGMSSTGELKSPPGWVPSDEGGKHLEIEFEYSAKIWPYHGYLALHISVLDSGKDFTGIASGDVIFTVTSPPAQGESEPRASTVKVPVKVRVIPTPPREKRILWDQFHSISYPSGFLPSDNRKKDQLDWLGDHPHTNFWTLTEKLQNAGYFLEILGHPATCFDAENYGAYLVVDPEEEWFKEEVDKLHIDVKQKGLHLLVLAEWYDLKKMEQLRFFDDNTRSFWTPITGGCNVPALNDLLGKFDIELGGEMAYLDGTPSPPVVSSFSAMYSGSPILKFPKGGTMVKTTKGLHGVVGSVSVGKGHVSVLGDSSLFDDGNKNMGGSGHFEGLEMILQKTYKKDESRYLLEEDFKADPKVKPAVRPKDVNFAYFSNVVGKEPFCGCRTRKMFRSKGQPCMAAAASSDFQDVKVGSNVKAAPSSSVDWEENPRPKTSNLFDNLGLNGERGHATSDLLHPPKKTTPGDKDTGPTPVLVNSQSTVKLPQLPHLDNQMSLIMGAGGLVLVLLLWRLNAQTAPGARRVARAGRRLPESAV